MTKRESTTVKVNNDVVERSFREALSRKVCGTLVGLWFLVAEHLRLGTWDLIKGYTGCGDADLQPRIAMQIVNEAAICSNRIRRSNYISHQGFELLNGLGFLVTDEQVHEMLDMHTIQEAYAFQETLALIRRNNGHYAGGIIAIDPHRIMSTSQRIMPKKKKQPDQPASKMLQTFFAIDAQTGQPIGFGIGSPGTNTSDATIDLLHIAKTVDGNALIMADKEHFTENLFRRIRAKDGFEFLVPAISSERINKIVLSLHYKPLWAGYSIAETMFSFSGHKEKYRLICQREGERENDYTYKPFLAISEKPAVKLLTEDYPERWSIEEFFNFDGAMGFDRASTFNLNIRYGKMSLALLAQAATYGLRQKLPSPYKQWDAIHLAEALFNKIDGDIRVKKDTIFVTCYNAPADLNLQQHYQGLPEKLVKQGVSPKVPWLYNYKLDFRFK